MKKLSVEEKARAYDEALQRTRKWYDSNTNKGFRGIFEDIFPELAVSEDEEIKKEIKLILANTDLSQFALDYAFADMLNWLEKQDKQSLTLYKIATILSKYEDKEGSPLEQIRAIMVDNCICAMIDGSLKESQKTK